MESLEVRDEAEDVLKALAGADTRLREDQWEAIRALVLDHRRVLCVQRTGWGKSAVYFIATALLRRRGSGPTLIISPLLALMRNQIDAALRAGISARTINSSNANDWPDVYEEILDTRVDVLLVSPERLTHPDFRDYILPQLSAATGLVVVDEAHCISDWGHDFRPDYRRIRSLLAGLPRGIPVLATTATANARVVEDVADQLGETVIFRGPLDRQSLRLAVLSFGQSAERLAWAAEHLGSLPGSGIVYTLTVAGAEQAADFLRSRGHDVHAYSSETDADRRQELEQLLLENNVKALVATSALGMGFDKRDLGFVVHLGAPSSPIAYYQQIGRAGRALENAPVVLLPSDQDLRVWRYFASLSFPPETLARQILQVLTASDKPLSAQALEASIDLSKAQLAYTLKVLDVEGAVRRQGNGWVATGAPWTHDTARYERVSAARDAEQDAMLKYIALGTCRMQFLRECLDDPLAAPCGRCDNCAGEVVPREVRAETLAALTRHLDRVGIEITPRLVWPTGLPALGIPLKGRIAPTETAASGRAIARLTDLGWGEKLVPLFEDMNVDARVPEQIVNQASKVVDEIIGMHATDVAGLVAVDSHRRPALLRSVLQALQSHTGLPLLGFLTRDRSRPIPSRANSARQVATMYDTFSLPRELNEAIRAGSPTILLIDDLVDSGWTMTLAARELRLAGAAQVIPFALATRGRRD